jgi:hypothetical protein
MSVAVIASPWLGPYALHYGLLGLEWPEHVGGRVPDAHSDACASANNGAIQTHADRVGVGDERGIIRMDRSSKSSAAYYM